MNCTKCKSKIEKGQKYHRTKNGAYHADCPKASPCKPHIRRRELEEDLIILKAKILMSEKVRDEKIFGEAWFNAHTYVTYLLGQKAMLEQIMARVV